MRNENITICTFEELKRVYAECKKDSKVLNAEGDIAESAFNGYDWISHKTADSSKCGYRFIKSDFSDTYIIQLFNSIQLEYMGM